MNLTNKKTAAIILAGGIGSRMGSDVTKQRMELCGVTVLKRSVIAFDRCDLIDYIVVVARKEEIDFVTSEVSGLEKVCAVTVGGATRAESAKCGLATLPDDAAFIAIHDAARPLITPGAISRVVEAAHTHGAATAAAKLHDTVKLVSDQGVIHSTIPRDTIMRAQTPQVFDLALYCRALDSYDGDYAAVTDDNMLLEAIGAEIVVVDTGEENIKITTPIDLTLAQLILQNRGGENV